MRGRDGARGCQRRRGFRAHLTVSCRGGASAGEAEHIFERSFGGGRWGFLALASPLSSLTADLETAPPPSHRRPHTLGGRRRLLPFMPIPMDDAPRAGVIGEEEPRCAESEREHARRL